MNLNSVILRHQDFQTVHIGRLFIEASDMLLAYETYCVNQSAAPALIDQLEREKDLLRVFLHEAQNEVGIYFFSMLGIITELYTKLNSSFFIV